MSVRRNGFGRRATAALVGILTLVAGRLTLAQPLAWQSPESIREAARSFVVANLDAAADVSVQAVAVDDRLKLPACTVPLDAHAQSELRNGQGTVAVSCAGTQPWRLFVPVRASSRVAVVVARRTLQAGAPIAAADLDSVLRSTSALPYEYFTDAAQAVGLTARRTIPAGTVLAPGALNRALAVERGALVTLVAQYGPVLVKTEGTALEAGKLNERVRVRSQSGRIVEGVVESPNEVRVGS
jgi:flagella basal body P-ring formation protein FlgA